MKRLFVVLTIVAASVSGVGTLEAQGFGIYEHGTCAMGRAGAGIANPCADASAMFYNPAGIAGHKGFVASAGVTPIAAAGSFTTDLTGTRTNLANDPIPVPHAYIQYGPNEKLGVGVGLFVPYGLTTRWPSDFEGRFLGYDNTLQSIYIQPTVAYKAGRISFGAGLDIVIGKVNLHQRLDLFEQRAPAPAPAGTILGQLGVPFHTQFADGALDASGATGVGGHAGIQVRATDWLMFGARYLSQVKLDYSGSASFSPAATGITLPAGNPFGAPAGAPLDVLAASFFLPGGPLSNQSVTTSITMPDQIVAGVSVKATSRLTLLADYQWVHWKVFDTLTLSFSNPLTPTKQFVENFRSTSGVRVGGEWAGSDRFTIRGGWDYHQAAAPPETVTPLLPEGTRHEFTGGLGVNFTKQVRADFAYQYIKQQDRRGRVRDPLPGAAPTTSLNSGLFAFHAHLVAATVTVRF